MARYYDKDELKAQLELPQIYDLLEAWGAEPEYSDKGIICSTICHNIPKEGSHKLYYYENNGIGLFRCYTSCGDSFDIMQLCIKVMKIQKNLDWELWDAMDYIAGYFGIAGKEQVDAKDASLKDWDIFKKHKKALDVQHIEPIQLKEYNPIILTRFTYPRILNWEKEGIKDEVCKRNLIGFYAGKDQITIPHYDINNRLIGLRGRSVAEDEAERYGKYRPIKIGEQLYNHPLSMNLYHLNKSKENMRRARAAVVFESEKACLMAESIYGAENDISCSCCGSNLSAYQVQLLRQQGVNEIIIAFDRDFESYEDNKYDLIVKKLIHLYNKYKKIVSMSFVFDKDMILPIHSSPIDQGKEIFEKLLRERVRLD